MTGAEIASTTAGTGAGGSVAVTTPGVLVLDGAGVANTQIAASAIGPQSGPGGSVMVAANALTIAIQVTGVAGTGEVPVDPRNAAALPVTSFGQVDIKSSGSTRSLLTASTPSGPGSRAARNIGWGLSQLDRA